MSNGVFLNAVDCNVRRATTAPCRRDAEWLAIDANRTSRHLQRCRQAGQDPVALSRFNTRLRIVRQRRRISRQGQARLSAEAYQRRLTCCPQAIGSRMSGLQRGTGPDSTLFGIREASWQRHGLTNDQYQIAFDIRRQGFNCLRPALCQNGRDIRIWNRCVFGLANAHDVRTSTATLTSLRRRYAQCRCRLPNVDVRLQRSGRDPASMGPSARLTRRISEGLDRAIPRFPGMVTGTATPESSLPALWTKTEPPMAGRHGLTLTGINGHSTI